MGYSYCSRGDAHIVELLKGRPPLLAALWRSSWKNAKLHKGSSWSKGEGGFVAIDGVLEDFYRIFTLCFYQFNPFYRIACDLQSFLHSYGK